MNVGTIKNSVVVTTAPGGAGRRRRCLTLFWLCIQSGVCTHWLTAVHCLVPEKKPLNLPESGENIFSRLLCNSAWTVAANIHLAVVVSVSKSMHSSVPPGLDCDSVPFLVVCADIMICDPCVTITSSLSAFSSSYSVLVSCLHLNQICVSVLSNKKNNPQCCLLCFLSSELIVLFYHHIIFFSPFPPLHKLQLTANCSPKLLIGSCESVCESRSRPAEVRCDNT